MESVTEISVRLLGFCNKRLLHCFRQVGNLDSGLSSGKMIDPASDTQGIRPHAGIQSLSFRSARDSGSSRSWGALDNSHESRLW